MSNRYLLTKLEEAIKEQVPGFEVKFKNESKFMILINKILFFNKHFMTNYVTTIGKIPYWQSREAYEADPDNSFDTLAHEFIHIMDYILHPVSFTLGYLFPQILAAPGVIFILLLPIFITLMCFSLMSPWWLLMLLFLGFLVPLSAPFRKNSEMRGYGMSLRVKMWKDGKIPEEKFERTVKAFTGPNYYYMWPHEGDVRRELFEYSLKHDPAYIKNDENPAWRIVYNVLKKNGALYE